MANFFPRWTNWLPLKISIAALLIVCGLTAGTWYYVNTVTANDFKVATTQRGVAIDFTTNGTAVTMDVAPCAWLPSSRRYSHV